MNEQIQLDILTPQGSVYSAAADSLLVPTEQGPLEISPGYTKLLTAISPAAVLRVTKNGKHLYFAIFGGVLQVKFGGDSQIYTEEINDGYSIDMARAIAARDRNLDLIAKKEEGTNIALAQAKLAKAAARISAKSLSEGKE